MSPPSNVRSASLALSALALSAVVGSALLAAVPASAATTTTTTTVTVAPTDDTYIDSASSNRNFGASTKVLASQTKSGARTGMFKFRVPAAPAGGVLSAARLQLTTPRSLPARVDLRRLTSSTWTEGTVTYKTGVRATDTLRSVAPSTTARTLGFEMKSLVAPGTIQAFGVTTPAGTAELVSTEATTGRPSLVLTYTVTTTTPDPPANEVQIGMSTPLADWDLRLTETGGVDSRRIFDDLSTPDPAVNLAKSEVAAGRLPILSFKVPSTDWAGVGAGTYDSLLRSLTTKLDAIPGQVFVTLHHEPTGDGTPTDYAAMMRHALPILAAPSNVDAGPIVNGFWFSKTAMGYTDAEIAQWLPADVLRLSEVVASDTYQGGDAANPGENAGVKIQGMSAWATRVGVTRLGIGEYNGVDAASITAAGDAILADPRYVFAAIYNSNVNNREGIDWTLTGDRLQAFKQTVAKARAMNSTP